MSEQLYTFDEAVKALNNICTGLGVRVNHYYDGEYKKSLRLQLSKWVQLAFPWFYTEEGLYFWSSMHIMLKEFENGKGCLN